MKKKMKDLTLEEVQTICKKARTNEKGKISKHCQQENCPLGSPREFQFTLYSSLRMCDIICSLNKEIEVEENEY